jgi:hypothetical protein
MILKRISKIIANYMTSSHTSAECAILGQIKGADSPSALYLILKVMNDEPTGRFSVIQLVQEFCSPETWKDKEPIRRDVLNMLNEILFAVNLQIQEDGTIISTLEKISHSTNVGLHEFTFESGVMEVNPVFKARRIIRTEILCFVLMPFKSSFDRIYKESIKNAVESCGLKCFRADDLFLPTIILEDIWIHICKSKIIIADVTGRNPNVFYELGIAHTLGKPVIIITQNKTDIPFDIAQFRYILYSNSKSGLNLLRDNLSVALNNTIGYQ